jgi:cytochrome c-type biogenesis protein CcsB
MNLINIENFLVKFSFLLLFFSMLSYLIETAFFFRKKEIMFGKIFMGVANIFLVSFLVLRWYESGHFPLSNLYESLIFLAWSLSLIHLYLEFMIENQLIGCVTSPTILLIQAFGTLSLPPEMQQPTALVPALQSNWLMMHVTLMILSYSALILGSLFSIGYLIVTRETPAISQNELQWNQNSEIELTLPLNNSNKTSELSKMFDNLSYRILGIGFPLLTIGILSGAVWANEAWGSYWSWDPKETWALLTWLIFAIYLHTRFTKGWSGKKPALIASLGFLSVWICFLGVNLLGQGLHSYGWLTS